MAYSPDATSMVLGAFISAINSDLRRRARKRKLRGRLQTGSLTVVQRFGSSLNLNVHFHAIVMDGVYAEQPDGTMLFHPLPAPSDENIARLARAVCRKVTRYLAPIRQAPTRRAKANPARSTSPRYKEGADYLGHSF
jgi:hypothetical protein